MSPTATSTAVRYESVAQTRPEGDGFTLTLPTDGLRSDAALEASLARPAVVRDALRTMHDILTSDLRRKATSREDYLAYLLSKGKRVSVEVWNAQKAYLASKFGTPGEADEADEAPLDPIVHVDDTGLSLEVFSADESAYARLHLREGEALSVGSKQTGTSHLDLTDAALQRAVGRVRAYRDTTLQVRPSTGGKTRAFAVPHRWLRAFGQVQAASTLPSIAFTLDPIDLYNLLLSLRLRKAKTSPRALRYELVPGEKPRLVLEPWETVLEGTGPAFEGPVATVVRTWGRRRLSALAPILPHAKSVTVHLVGAGLPAYYVIDLGDASLTLALSGWTDSGWAGIATFDLLSSTGVDEVLSRRVLELLGQAPQSLEALASETGRPAGEVRRAVLDQMQRGMVLRDMASGQLVRRPLMENPPSAEALRFRDDNEREAHRLLDTEGAVTITRVHHLPQQGTRIEGEVTDAVAHRTYKTSFTLDREGRTIDADCTSPQFRRAGLREGPTIPMIALRLAHARAQAQLEEARNTPEGRKLIVAETRIMTRRSRAGVMTYRLSLDDRRVVVRWGERPEQMRVQKLFFADAEGAKAEYFSRLDALGDKGFVDASAAEAV